MPPVNLAGLLRALAWSRASTSWKSAEFSARSSLTASSPSPAMDLFMVASFQTGLYDETESHVAW